MGDAQTWNNMDQREKEKLVNSLKEQADGMGSIVKLATVTEIDAKVVAATSLYTVPAGKKLIVKDIVVRVTAFTDGGKTIQATCSFGANTPNFDDQYAGFNYTFTAINRKIINLDVTATEFPIYTVGQILKLNITIGSNATLETWAVDVFGYLV